METWEVQDALSCVCNYIKIYYTDTSRSHHSSAISISFGFWTWHFSSLTFHSSKYLHYKLTLHDYNCNNNIKMRKYSKYAKNYNPAWEKIFSFSGM